MLPKPSFPRRATHPTSAPRFTSIPKTMTMTTTTRQPVMPCVRPPRLLPDKPPIRQGWAARNGDGSPTALRGTSPWPALPARWSLRNRVERPIRTTAIPPCHWPCCTSCAASPSNPNSPRSLMRRFCVMTIHVRRSLGCRSCRRAKNLTLNWSPRRRPPVKTQPPPSLVPADFIHLFCSRNLQTPSAYRHAGAYQAPSKRRPLAAGGCSRRP